MNIAKIMTKSLVIGILGWCCFAYGGEIQDAAQKSDYRKVRTLLKADPKLVNSNSADYGWTALHKAANVGDKAMAKLLFAYKADGNVKDEYGATPLHWAAGYGKKDVVKVLLAHKVQLNAEDKSGQTPLHWAAEYDREDVVKILLHHKADAQAKDKNGKTALQLAEASGQKNKNIVRLLQKYMRKK